MNSRKHCKLIFTQNDHQILAEHGSFAEVVLSLKVLKIFLLKIFFHLQEFQREDT